MKRLWDEARYDVIKQELLYGVLCMKEYDVSEDIRYMILEYVCETSFESNTCECDLDRCHWCVYQDTDNMGGPYRLPMHNECLHCVTKTYQVEL